MALSRAVKSRKGHFVILVVLMHFVVCSGSRKGGEENVDGTDKQSGCLSVLYLSLTWMIALVWSVALDAHFPFISANYFRINAVIWNVWHVCNCLFPAVCLESHLCRWFIPRLVSVHKPAHVSSRHPATYLHPSDSTSSPISCSPEGLVHARVAMATPPSLGSAVLDGG